MMAYIALTMIIKEDKSTDYIYAAPPFRMIDFCLGILLYRFYRSEKGKQVYALITTQFSTWQAHLADVAIVLLSAGMYYLSIYTNPNFRCAALYWLPAVVSIFYFVASDQGKGWLTRLFHHKALLWLGSISFEIFICHSLCFRIVQSIFIRMFGIDNPYWEYKLIIALTLTILTSWMAKKFLVTPCSNYLKNTSNDQLAFDIDSYI